jgi:PAS domain S-box-containing protein
VDETLVQLEFQKFALDEHADVTIADRDGRIIYANDRFCEISKYSRAELLGRNHRILNSGYHPLSFFEQMYAVIARGDTWRGEVCNRAKDGTFYWVNTTIVPFRSHTGTIEHFVAIRSDITKTKQAEAALQASIADLAARNRDLDEFTYIASHDLQEPLRKLISFSKLLPQDVGGDLPERAVKDIGFIVDAAARMQMLVQDLLALSRAGRAEIRLATVPLATSVKRALEALELQVNETGACITCEDLPAVKGDPTLLAQLFQNLIGNALKFRRADVSPEICITVEHKGDDQVVGVCDNGIGIKPQYADCIFAPFKRLHGRTEYPGTGIGLSICKRVVERHGGRIWVEPALRGGAHFKFTLQAIQENKPCSAGMPEQPSFCL